MKITVAPSAGFCFGVNRAVETVEGLVASGESVATLGPLIHNPLFIKSLESRGVKVIEKPDELPDGSTLVIRTHGITRDVREEIERLGCKYVDATCPFVAKIHKIVSEHSVNADRVIIAGDAAHPEVLGIASCSAAPVTVCGSEQMLEEKTRSGEINPDERIIMVSQTTFSKNIFKKMKIFSKKLYTNIEIFDTICNATALRQDEAVALATENDIMLVIGGANSSNTRKLYELCSEKTRSYLIEDVSDLKVINIEGISTIGVTAGASTPSGKIKEVITHMDEIKNIEAAAAEGQAAVVAPEEESFAEMFNAMDAEVDSTSKEVEGFIDEISNTEFKVSIVGRKQTGIVAVEDFSDDINVINSVKVGEKYKFVIMKTNDVDGVMSLSKKLYDKNANWHKIVEADENNEILEGVVGEVNAYGVIVDYCGVRVFIPGRCTGIGRGGRFEDLLNSTVKFEIISIDPRRKSAKGSIAKVLDAEKKEKEAKFWAEAEVGMKFNGTVKSITDFGAFVDIGGVEGLVHRTELSWKRIKHPSDIVSVGEELEVFIKALDPEKKRISLGYKKVEDQPWEVFKREYAVGDELTVKVQRLTGFGAFASIIPEIDGLIHVSEISYERVNQPSDVLTVGQEVQVKIISIDDEKKRIGLSMKALLTPPEKPAKKAEKVEEEVFYDDTPKTYSLDDMIAEANKQEAAAADETAEDAE